MLVRRQKGQAQGIDAGLGEEGSAAASSCSKPACGQLAVSLQYKKHAWKS